jgi:hypothetical protein
MLAQKKKSPANSFPFEESGEAIELRERRCRRVVEIGAVKASYNIIQCSKHRRTASTGNVDQSGVGRVARTVIREGLWEAYIELGPSEVSIVQVAFPKERKQ